MNRRAARLELTDEGEAVLARVWWPMIRAMDEVWQEIPPDDLVAVVRTMIRLRDSCLERLSRKWLAIGRPTQEERTIAVCS